MTIWGATEAMPHRRLDVQLNPCDPSKNRNCEDKKNNTIDYVGTPDLLMWINRQRFQPNMYNNMTIINESFVIN